MPRDSLIKKRRGTAAAWTSANPTLAAGEEGFETDTRKSKVGDGSTAWTSLNYTVAVGSGAFGTPAVALGTAAAAGSAGTAVRTDATIVAFDATSPSTQAFGDTAVVGVAAVAARRDHKHAMPATPTSVSGNAGTATALQNARTINGVSFDGTANITNIAEATHAATTKATPVDADELPLADSAASFVLKKLTWANLKATLKTYFDTLYAPVGGGAGTVTSVGSSDSSITVTNPTTTPDLVVAKSPKLTTARTINGTSFDGTANITTAMGTLTRSPRSSNTILAAADRGTVICATAAYTQTLTAAATLGTGWWVIVKNDTQDGTTVLVLDPNASETIDGLTTATMYSGETRLIECDGSNFTSQLLNGGYAKFVPSGLGTFVVPAGIEYADVVCIGSGGQGGGGNSGSAGSGGGAGGGGSTAVAHLRATDLGAAGSSITVTAAAGGTGAGTPVSGGADGAATTFGTLLKAGGGGAGGAGQSGTFSLTGGGGGSVVNSAASGVAGSPSATNAIGAQSSANVTGNGTPTSSEWGGSVGGGCTSATAGKAGGSSIYAGPGGGGGSGSSGQPGGAGGATKSYTVGGGASGGTSGAASTKGDDGTFTGPYCGTGGGGGGGTATAGRTAGAGGVGSIGAGGGGGGCGSGATSVGGTGGVGGVGECRVTFS